MAEETKEAVQADDVLALVQDVVHYLQRRDSEIAKDLQAILEKHEVHSHKCDGVHCRVK